MTDPAAPHLPSDDTEKSDKRQIFGNRKLTEEQNVYEFNAW
jgi:hypothetical protein